MKKLSEQELADIKNIQESYSKATIQLGELEVRIEDHKDAIKSLEEEKGFLRKDILNLRQKDQELSAILVEKYGSGEINTETGEITEK